MDKLNHMNALKIGATFSERPSPREFRQLVRVKRPPEEPRVGPAHEIDRPHCRWDTARIIPIPKFKVRL